MGIQARSRPGWSLSSRETTRSRVPHRGFHHADGRLAGADHDVGDVHRLNSDNGRGHGAEGAEVQPYRRRARAASRGDGGRGLGKSGQEYLHLAEHLADQGLGRRCLGADVESRFS